MDGSKAQKSAPDSLPVELAHQLGNQLTIVLGSLERLHQQSLDETGRRYLERAEAAAHQAGRLLHRCIGTAKTETDSMGDITTDQRGK